MDARVKPEHDELLRLEAAHQRRQIRRAFEARQARHGQHFHIRQKARDGLGGLGERHRLLGRFDSTYVHSQLWARLPAKAF